MKKDRENIIIPVLAALIADEDGKILLARRNQNTSRPLKWEFPGGKLKAGESPQACLVREIKEELEMEIECGDIVIAVNHSYPDICILLLAYRARPVNKQYSLHEHVAIRWVEVQRLTSFDLSPADIPIAEALIAEASRTEGGKTV